MIKLNQKLSIPLSEINFSAIRAQGAGGQNVNKVSSAIHLRFSIRESSLPEEIKQGLLNLADQRISKEGVVVIKAQEHRTQEANKQEAIARLSQLIKSVLTTAPKRISTKPRKSAVKKRLDHKTKHGQLKNVRRKVTDLQS
jgi:ribosome-associated protein